jgi:hypothetical protein
MWVMFTGYGGAGKDTAAAIVSKRFGGVDTLSFADGVRVFASALNSYLPEVGCTYNEIVERVGYTEAKAQFPCVRNYLVAVGEHARNTFGEDVWIRRLDKAARKRVGIGEDPDRDSNGHKAALLIPDCRYENEAEYGRSTAQFCLVFKITRPGCEAKHETERVSIEKIRCDAEIINNGTIEDLEANLMSLLDRHTYYDRYRAIPWPKTEMGFDPMEKLPPLDPRWFHNPMVVRERNIYVSGGVPFKKRSRFLMSALEDQCRCKITCDWTRHVLKTEDFGGSGRCADLDPRIPYPEPKESDHEEFEGDFRLKLASDAEKDIRGVTRADLLVVVFSDRKYAFRGTMAEIGAMEAEIENGKRKGVIIYHECEPDQEDPWGTYLRSPFVWPKKYVKAHVFSERDLVSAVNDFFADLEGAQ